METETLQKIKELEEKVDKIYASTEKTRKYFLWMMIGSIALIVLPLLGLVFALPSFLSNYSATTLQNLSQ